MKRPRLASQGSIERMLQAAEISWRSKDFQQSIDTLERAARLDPGNPSIQIRLGRNYGMTYDYAAAERCFDKAVRLAPRKGEMLALAGQQAQDFRNPELASRLFQQALQHADLSPESLVKAAEQAERARKTEEAARLIDRALQLNPALPPALLVRARLDRLANRLEAAEQGLRSIPAGADSATRAKVCYELGAVLDRQKRYDEAMTAFLEAKSIMRLDAAPFLADLKTMRSRLVDLRESLSSEILQRWFAAGSELQPQRRLALLGGHPRSGTTLLEQVLDSHPEAVSAEETEIFIDNAYAPLTREFPQSTPMLPVLEGASLQTLRRARENYFGAMELSLGQSVGNRLLIDKNPSYTFLVPSMVRIFPEIKVMVALRDPRDVVLSCFMQSFVPLGQANAAFLSLDRAVDEYVALMTMWRKVTPLLKNPWIEVRYEDMVEDLESVSRRVLEFLGLSWDAQVLKFDEHARQKTVRSPTYADVTKPVFKTAMGRWRHYEKYFEPHLSKLEPFVKAFGYG